MNGQEVFLSGMNLAWGNFASDLTAFKEPTYQKALDERTTMKYVQQFINLTAGAIHKEAPKEKVSNGSWSFRASSDMKFLMEHHPGDVKLK